MDQLHIRYINPKTSKSEKIICYKEEDILTKGWCNTIGLNAGGLRGWGICSESCKFLKNGVDREQSSEDFNKVCTCKPHYSMPIISDKFRKAVSSVELISTCPKKQLPIKTFLTYSYVRQYIMRQALS